MAEPEAGGVEYFMVRCCCSVMYEGTDGDFAERLFEHFTRHPDDHQPELLSGMLVRREAHALVR